MKAVFAEILMISARANDRTMNVRSDIGSDGSNDGGMSGIYKTPNQNFLHSCNRNEVNLLRNRK